MWQGILAVLGIVVPVVAFLWEFFVIGRKRLGYRVQMDTTATNEIISQHAAPWQRLLGQRDGERLRDPSFVLLRLENIGTTEIDESDYSVLHHNKVGVRVRFPERRVVAMAVTEISSEIPYDNFNHESGLGVRNVEEEDSPRIHGEIELPKVPLNRRNHYKVMAILERGTPGGGSRPKFPAPEVLGGIKGGVIGGGIEQTESRTGTPRWAKALIYALVFVSLAEPTVYSRFFAARAAPLDCFGGKVTINGSTAFMPVLNEAAKAYKKACPNTEADISFVPNSSQAGLDAVNRAGDHGTSPDDLLAFSDGPKQAGQYPRLVQRSIAFQLFTIVANPKAGVDDLPRSQLSALFVNGKYTNWKQINGNNLPISIIDRNGNSGTRSTLQKNVLNGALEPGYNSNDCVNRIAGTADRAVRCERETTDSALDTVAGIDGAIGYAELGAAMAASERGAVTLVQIDGKSATLTDAEHRAYPFGETEYAYTYRRPQANSLAASFLRFLTNEIGQDVVRRHGDLPCADLPNPVVCSPEAP